MKRALTIIGLLIFGLVQPINAQDVSEPKFSHGVLFMAGGRYDNLRRCAATPAGTKGGPIADIMFITKYKLNSNHNLLFNLPVFRPILFGLAFKMLQFEPEFIYEYSKVVNEKINLITGPGLGVSIHYGPDYQSELRDMDKSFFAIGPFFSWQTGLAFKRDGIVKSSASIKAFYVPLLAKDRSVGTVLGGALLYTIYFK